ncbi:MAG TPA: hypothetical protein VD816_08265 [Ohtaekwangia sp.]|nr:hypothetical protein [Ohtaekwangia sp.]
MTSPKKLNKFIDKLQELVRQLEKDRNVVVHQHVNQFYYMQKIAELRTLAEQFAEAEERIVRVSGWIDEEYATLFRQWRKDLHWLRLSRQSL